MNKLEVYVRAEGPSASGKTTILKGLKEVLEFEGFYVEGPKEGPFGWEVLTAQKEVS
jgi:thymidylate kinase